MKDSQTYSFNPCYAELPLFEGVPPEKIPHVLRCLNASYCSAERGERIRMNTNRATYYLCSGRAQIVRYDYQGNTSILGAFGAGSVLGAETFFELESAQIGEVVAAEDCNLLAISLNETVKARTCCMVHVNRIRENLARITMQMNSDLMEHLGIVSMRTTREKILAYLFGQTQKQQKCEFDIPFSRQELADNLYVERSALSHELGRLQKDGLIRFHRNHFTLLVPAV